MTEMFDNKNKKKRISITANRYFSLTQVTTTASTYFDANVGGLQVRQSEECRCQKHSIL